MNVLFVQEPGHPRSPTWMWRKANWWAFGEFTGKCRHVCRRRQSLGACCEGSWRWVLSSEARSSWVLEKCQTTEWSSCDSRRANLAQLLGLLQRLYAQTGKYKGSKNHSSELGLVELGLPMAVALQQPPCLMGMCSMRCCNMLKNMEPKPDRRLSWKTRRR